MKARLILRWDGFAKIYRLIRLTTASRMRQLTIGLHPHLWRVTREFGGTIVTILGVRFHYKNTFGGGYFAD